MKLSELMTALRYFADDPDYADFDVAICGPQGPVVRHVSVSVAEPAEKLIAIGCSGFVMRADLQSGD